MAKGEGKRNAGDSPSPSHPDRPTWSFDDLADGADSRPFEFDTEIAPSFPGVFRSEHPQRIQERGGPPELHEHEGDFEILKELRRGASGVVYLAKQRSLQREVALKVIHNIGSESRTMAL